MAEMDLVKYFKFTPPGWEYTDHFVNGRKRAGPLHERLKREGSKSPRAVPLLYPEDHVQHNIRGEVRHHG